MSKPAVTLFVEFEGVLQPEGVNVRPLPFAPLLSELLGPQIQQVEIVVSDRRALREPLDVLCSRLTPDIASRVVDAVYLPELTSTTWSDYFSALASRYDIIELWLNRKRPRSSHGWLAMERGSQMEAWPMTQREHVVWGSLGDRRVQQAFVERLLVQIRRARPLNLTGPNG